MQLWDEAANRIRRAVVSAYNLKAIFFVEQWDSRSLAEQSGTAPVALPLNDQRRASG